MWYPVNVIKYVLFLHHRNKIWPKVIEKNYTILNDALTACIIRKLTRAKPSYHSKPKTYNTQIMCFQKSLYQLKAKHSFKWLYTQRLSYQFMTYKLVMPLKNCLHLYNVEKSAMFKITTISAVGFIKCPSYI